MTETTIYTKYLGTFSRFSTVFLQHKLNRTRLLLGEVNVRIEVKTSAQLATQNENLDNLARKF